MKRVGVMLLAALFMGLMLLAGGGGALAGAGVISSPARATPEQVKTFWTTQRIRQALKNAMVKQREGSPPMVLESVEPPQGEPFVSPPYCPDCDTPLAQPAGDNFVIAGPSCPVSSYQWSFDTNYTSYPQRVVGRLFFSTPDGGVSSCSASLVQNKLLLTAGHCVAGDGAWYDNFMFIPGYLQGSHPWGEAYAARKFTFTSWFYNEDFSHDVAFIILTQSIGDALGWLGFVTNQDYRQLTWYQFGYPADAPFDGSLMAVNLSAFGYQDCSVGIPCDLGVGSPFTGGSSGGPWVLYQDDGMPYANGLNSYRYSNCGENMYSPYFGDDVKSLWDEVLGYL